MLRSLTLRRSCFQFNCLRYETFDRLLTFHNKRRLSYISIIKFNKAHVKLKRLFTSDNRNSNDNSNNSSPNSNSQTNNSNSKNNSLESYNNKTNNAILAQSTNQSSLVRNRLIKSVVPYLNDILVIPLSKPFFPGFATTIEVRNEELKIYFLSMYKNYLNNKKNNKNIISKYEWIGTFLHDPYSLHGKKPDNDRIKFENNSNKNNSNETDIENIVLNDYENNNITQTNIDEISIEFGHRVPLILKNISDIFEIGTLAKIDWEDNQASNISVFKKYDDKQIEKLNSNDKQIKSNTMEEDNIWNAPMYLKLIGGRRIRINYVSNDIPMHCNIHHLEPWFEFNKNISNEYNNLSEEDLSKLQKDYDIKLKTQYNYATDLMRSILYDDPDNRNEMSQLWKRRHEIDVGFFADFASNLTNSTPRELQNILECIDYNTRLSELIKLLQREQLMLQCREEIIKDMNKLIKQENSEKYLQMIMASTNKKLTIIEYQKRLKYFKEKEELKQFESAQQNEQQNDTQTQQSEQQENNNDEQDNSYDNFFNSFGTNSDGKDTRYQKLAKKYVERIKDKTLNPEAKEAFYDCIEKLCNVKSPIMNQDLETSKQYADWLSSLPWNVYTQDNNNINNAYDILNEDHYGMEDVKEKILELIAINILKNDNNDNTSQNSNNGKILCLVGPPGVGKTSIGSSIAKALNKKFYKFSMGGNDDSHLLKGFLRTYVGSNPGKIIYGLKQTQCSNPLILIDELDKIGARHSDPSHALLEILDPSQNNSFVDSYLEVPYDLSKILFICTANDENKINPILKDRLNIIKLSGYDYIEKLNIAKKYLIPKSISKSGLNDNNITLNDEILNELIKWYCRESGVRSLEQHIEKITSKVALELARQGYTFKDINKHLINDSNKETNENKSKEINGTKTNNDINNNDGSKVSKILGKLVSSLKFNSKIEFNETNQNNNNNINNINSSNDNIEESETINDNIKKEDPIVVITLDNLKSYVGPRKYTSDRTFESVRDTPPGVVTGLAYNNIGGSTTYIETVKYKKHNKSLKSKDNSSDNENDNESSGGGSIRYTGQLGKVMSESIEIAYVLARSVLYNKIDPNNTFFDNYHIHLHCPEGGISKDGPSAGITITTALLSLALNESISPNIAMTGEITLTGKILKIGGIKEKMLAAKRANIDTLIFPYDNKQEFYDEKIIPQYLRQEFKDVHFVKEYKEILDLLFNNTLDNCNNQFNFENEKVF